MNPLARRWQQMKARLDATTETTVPVPSSAVEVWRLMMDGAEPDPWQREILDSDHPRLILCCARQVGKSQTAAAKALYLCLRRPGSLVLLVSRSLRQSAEIGKKIFDGYRACAGFPAPEAESKLALTLVNGSRILCLPGGDPSSIRGYTANAVIADEAAMIDDRVFASLSPSLAVGGGSLILLSTPHGRRGFFYRMWEDGIGWHCVRITAAECPRLRPEFLRQEYLELGERIYRREYGAEFLEEDGQVFSDEVIADMFSHDVQPLFADMPSDDEGLNVADFPPLFEDATWDTFSSD